MYEAGSFVYVWLRLRRAVIELSHCIVNWKVPQKKVMRFNFGTAALTEQFKQRLAVADADGKIIGVVASFKRDTESEQQRSYVSFFLGSDSLDQLVHFVKDSFFDRRVKRTGQPAAGDGPDALVAAFLEHTQ